MLGSLEHVAPHLLPFKLRGGLEIGVLEFLTRHWRRLSARGYRNWHISGCIITGLLRKIRRVLAMNRVVRYKVDKRGNTIFS
jgi:hypothetical protein